MQDAAPSTSLDLSAHEVAEIALWHWQADCAALHTAACPYAGYVIPPHCRGCGQPWPCETARLCATIKALRQDRDNLIQMLADEQAWAAKCERERDQMRQRQADSMGQWERDTWGIAVVLAFAAGLLLGQFLRIH